MRTELLARHSKAALSLLRRGGDPATARLPETVLTTADVTVDVDEYAAYCRLHGFRLSGDLPPTYPHLLGFGSALRLFTDRRFPFSPVGMVHAHNRIVQHRPIAVTEPLTVRVRLADLVEHPKGASFDTVTEVTVADEPVWSEASTYVVRMRRRGAAATSSRAEPAVGLDDLEALWRVPGGTGRRYAAMSGDYNPIHLSRLSARVFGQRRAIAHGMWMLARCLGALDNRLSPSALAVTTDFRRPLGLPATVALASRREASGWRFGLLHPETGKPYLTGGTTSG